MADRRRLLSLTRLAIGLSIFFALVWYLVPSWAEVTTGTQLRLWPLALGLAGAAVAHVAVAARWKLLSEATGGTPLGLWAYLHSLLVTRFLGQFVSSLAMDLVGRGMLLRSVGSKRGVGHATTLVVLERIFDLVIPIGLLGWAVAIRQFGMQDDAVELLIALVVLFFIASTRGLMPLARIALAIYGRLRREGVESHPTAVGPWVSFQVGALSVVRFAAVLVQFAGIGAAVGVVISPADWAAATPIAQVTALFGVTPGGLGIVEIGWWGGLAWVGVARGSIALFLVAQRASLIGFLGVLALATWPLARRPEASSPAERTL